MDFLGGNVIPGEFVRIVASDLVKDLFGDKTFPEESVRIVEDDFVSDCLDDIVPWLADDLRLDKLFLKDDPPASGSATFAVDVLRMLGRVRSIFAE